MKDQTAKGRIAIAAGGTAGHINPALALAEELRNRGYEVQFFGQPERLEGSLVPGAGFELVPVEVSGFDRRRPWTLLSALIRMKKCEAALRRRFQGPSAPDCAIGFGAYIELPVLRACKKLGIPYLIHEQNSIVGLANKLSAAAAERICISFPAAQEGFGAAGKKAAEEGRLILTGNPVRSKVLGADRTQARTRLGIADDELLLVSFGGSLGAQHLNRALGSLKNELLSRPKLRVIQASGARDYDAYEYFLQLSDTERERWTLSAYVQEMDQVLAAADLVLSRAGASSLAEIAARSLPCILVPYPEATEDHQTTNARYLVDAGAALLFADEDIDKPEFRTALFDLLDHPKKRAVMAQAAHKLGQAEAAQVLADVLEGLISKKA